jgi:hypothetical protein
MAERSAAPSGRSVSGGGLALAAIRASARTGRMRATQRGLKGSGAAKANQARLWRGECYELPEASADGGCRQLPANWPDG